MKKSFDNVEKTVKRNLRSSIYEGSANSASASITDSYTTPFLIALGTNNFLLGLLSSMKSLAQMASQIPGSMLVEKLNRKLIFMISVAATQILWLIIILLFLTGGSNSLILILFLISASFFFQTLRSPAWTSLIGDIVPQHIRGRYFSKRNSILGLAGLIGTFIAGFLLTDYGFEVIFLISVILGFTTILPFMRIVEPPVKRKYFYKRVYSLSIRGYIKSFKSHKNFSVFTIYNSFLNFGVEFVGPFIAVYILTDLSASYEFYAFMIAMGILTRVIFQRYWGVISDRFGNLKIMKISGFMICLIPLFYAFSSNVYHVLLIKMFDGFVWAGHDLVKFNHLLMVTPSQKRPVYVARYNMITILGSVLGAAIGGVFAFGIESSTLLIFQGLQIIFLGSFILRALSFIILKYVKDVEKREDIVPVRYIMLYPISSSLEKGMNAMTTFTSRYPYRLKKLKILLDKSQKSKYVYVGRGKKSFHVPKSRKRPSLLHLYARTIKKIRMNTKRKTRYKYINTVYRSSPKLNI